MSEQPLSEVEQHLDEGINQEIEELVATYTTAAEEASKTTGIDDLDSYVSPSIEDVVGSVKRARQWEHKLDAHQRGLLNHSQVIEQIDDDKFGIEAQLTSSSA